MNLPHPLFGIQRMMFLVPFDRDAELSDDELTEMFPEQINGGIEQGATVDISAGAVELPAEAESVLPIEE